MCKTCSKCGETKVLEEFPKATRAICGRDTRCKSCARASANAYRAKNPEKVRSAQSAAQANRSVEQAARNLKSSAKYRAANREKLALDYAAYVAADPERVKAQKAAWISRNPDYAAAHYLATKPLRAANAAAKYAKNPEPTLKRAAAYRDANREKLAAWHAAHHKAHPEKHRANHARRKAAKAKATPPWADSAAINAVYELCVCIESLTGIPHHVDHVIPLRGKRVSGLHVAGNLQILTAAENLKKNNKFTV